MEKILSLKKRDPALDCRVKCLVCHAKIGVKPGGGIKVCPRCGHCRTNYIKDRAIVLEGSMGADFIPDSFDRDGMYEWYVGPSEWREGIGKAYSISGVAPGSPKANGILLPATLAGYGGMQAPQSSVRQMTDWIKKKE